MYRSTSPVASAKGIAILMTFLSANLVVSYLSFMLATYAFRTIQAELDAIPSISSLTVRPPTQTVLPVPINQPMPQIQQPLLKSVPSLVGKPLDTARQFVESYGWHLEVIGLRQDRPPGIIGDEHQ